MKVRDPPQTREALEKVTTERADIYICRPLEGMRVPLMVQSAEVDDGIPLELEIELAVRSLKGGRAGGLLIMCAEDMKGCQQEKNRKKYPVRRRWEIVIRLVQMAFRDNTLPEDLPWLTMILFLKGKGSIGESSLLR